MAATVAIKKRSKFGNGYAVTADVTFGSSYPTGGEALTAQQFGLSALDFVLPSPAAGYIFEFDHANKKLKAFTPTRAQSAHSHTENTAATYTQNATTATAGAISAAAASEVANNTNLSAVTARVLAVGY
jgi:hypothetical protein